MSQVRVHNFSISLDGFGTGDGLTLDAPFGHAGERLHEWMFKTRFWRSMVGEAGGSTGVDHAFAELNMLNIGAEIMGRIPHFYRADGEPDSGLALVQAQWGHLNHNESFLTLAQSLWVDDHHTLQMSWRSACGSCELPGTAGVWRSSAIEAVGGWRSTSLVEDCELTFRLLFALTHHSSSIEIVAPSELPATYTAYKAQQRRWTQGWVQVQRLLSPLPVRLQCSGPRRIHLLYHMCIAWQWPLWAIWITTLPFLIYTGYWYGLLGGAVGPLLYLLPPILWAVMSAS